MKSLNTIHSINPTPQSPPHPLHKDPPEFPSDNLPPPRRDNYPYAQITRMPVGRKATSLCRYSEPIHEMSIVTMLDA